MKKFGLFILSTLFSFQIGFTQCESWVNHSNEEDVSGWHSIYRQALKAKDYTTAFEFWEKVYEAAPTADGNRDYHFIDGVKLYADKFKNASSTEEKEQYKSEILKLYDNCLSCYESRKIKLAKCGTDSCYQVRMAQVMGRKGFDMYYSLNSLYSGKFCDFSGSS